MDCYFGSKSLPEGNDLHKSAIVAFTIPEIGIKFKAPFDGVDKNHSDFASLLALLEFIDSNQEYFKEKSYKIFGANSAIVAQVNERSETDRKFAGLMEKALKYKRKHKFSLRCLDGPQHPDFESLFD